MPIYEYECEQCGHRQEALQKVSDPPLSTCESCGGSLRKLLSSPAFQFKGTGWYVTDYARKSGDAAGASEKKGEDAAAKGEDVAAKGAAEKPAGGSDKEKGSSTKASDNEG